MGEHARENMSARLLVVAAVVAAASAQEDDFQCPDEFIGFYPHLYGCDKYWSCDNGFQELRTCGNGLAFIDTDESYKLEQCNEYHLVDCGARTELEPAISASNCPDFMEHMVILKTAVSFGTVKMVLQTDMSVPLALLLTKCVTGACGPTRFLSAVALLFQQMTKVVNSSVPLPLTGSSPSMPTPQTVGYTSSV